MFLKPKNGAGNRKQSHQRVRAFAISKISISKVSTRSPLKRPGFPKGEPESLYHRNSPWISSYHIQNSF